MKKIVFSKQADHDIDLAPFWLHWYKNIFRADTIIVTPLKLPTSSTKKIEDYYKHTDIQLIPIELEYWDANRIWGIQRDLISNILDVEHDFIVLSADTDQFFEPIDSLFIQDNLIVFERIDIIADRTPSVEDIDNINLRRLLPDDKSTLTPKKDFVACFINTLEHDDVFLTGHYTGSIERISNQNLNLKEYHIRLRGSDKFIKKVESLNFENLSGNVSWHFKRWVRIFEREGRDGLLAEYEAMMNSKNSSNDKEIKRFRALAKKSFGGVPTDWRIVAESLKDGEELFLHNRQAEAKSKFIEVLNMVPEHCHAVNNLGVLETSAGDLESGKRYFAKALEINPYCVDTLTNMGHVSNMMNQYEEAIRYFAKAIEIVDCDADLWNAVRECLLKLNEIDKAQSSFQEAMSLSGEQQNIEKIRQIIERSKSSLAVSPEEIVEKDRRFYDHLYASGGDNGEYHKHYSECIYYKIWTAAVTWILGLENPRVLEIGCGPGQFAKMLFDHGVTRYKGIGLSDGGIQMAKHNNPPFARLFQVDDVYTSKIFNEDYNVLIALEVFEHIQEDLSVIDKIRRGCEIIFSVPNFPDESHVRYFDGKDSIVDRYRNQIDIKRTLEFELVDGLQNKIFLMKGVKM